MRLIGLLLFLSLGSPPAGVAATWHVNPAGTGDASTIQAAVDLAASGDSIRLANGTYKGAGNRDIVIGDKALLLASEGGNPMLCRIDCEFQSRGLVLEAESNLPFVLEGIAIMRAYSAQSGDQSGAGISLIGRQITARHCRFEDCYPVAVTDDLGTGCTFSHCVFQGNDGGARLHWGSTFSFIDCSFAGNGFGLSVRETGPGTIKNCQFVGNTDTALYLTDAIMAEMDNCTFRQNWGGALSLYQDNTHFTQCVFENNAGIEGGAVNAIFSSPTFLDCSFTGNSASSAGGAVFGHFVEITMKNCLLVGNTAPTGGCFRTSAEWGAYGLQLESCTIYANSSSTGAIIEIEDDSDFKMSKSLLVGSSVGATMSCDATSSVEVICSDVFGNAGGNWTGCLAGLNGINGNISADPLFCNVATGNFLLTASSPCFNTPCGTMGAFGAGGCTTAVERGAEPAGFVLHPNVPNPFNPSTLIPLDVPQGGGRVVLEVYDVAGRLVRTLFDGVLPAGRHDVPWDGADASGAGSASGTYFVRLRTDGTHHSMKMVLLK